MHVVELLASPKIAASFFQDVLNTEVVCSLDGVAVNVYAL